jgi:hypothetical protein
MDGAIRNWGPDIIDEKIAITLIDLTFFPLQA